MHGAVLTSDVVRWILYWDKITFAGIGLNGASISGSQPEEIDYLESLGIFKTEIVDLQTLGDIRVPQPKDVGMKIYGIAGNQFPYVSAALRIKLCETLEKESGHIWSLGQSGGESLILPNIDQSKELIDIQLNECLPVPSVGTPFEDILNFKEQYRAELERLRFALDSLREKVISSSDERRALDIAMREISISLEDMRNAMSTNGIKVLNQSLSLYTENPSIGFWSALGGIVGASQGIPYEVAAGAGLAAPTAFTFLKRNLPGGNTLPNPKNDFSYAFKVSDEFK